MSSEFEQYPHLMNAVLGLQPWARHIRTINNINTGIMIFLVIIISVGRDFTSGLLYAGLFFAFRVLSAVVGQVVSGYVGMLSALIGTTVAMVIANILLFLHFSRIWSLI